MARTDADEAVRYKAEAVRWQARAHKAEAALKERQVIVQGIPEDVHASAVKSLQSDMDDLKAEARTLRHTIGRLRSEAAEAREDARLWQRRHTEAISQEKPVTLDSTALKAAEQRHAAEVKILNERIDTLKQTVAQRDGLIREMRCL